MGKERDDVVALSAVPAEPVVVDPAFVEAVEDAMSVLWKLAVT